MASGRLSVLRQLHRTALLPDGGPITDGQLLECFITRRDQDAFEALVRRHGPMVLGVCRRILRNAHDAEDAFQATFLVLVKKATSIGQRELVGNWLYGAAYRAALEAKAARRRVRERQVSAVPESKAAKDADVWLELRPVLDQELSRLPDKYRVAVVLCDMEGRTRKDVARQLGIPEGTLSGRLTTARRMLAGRLARHGFALSGGALAAALSQGTASACAPVLVASTVKVATLVAAGQEAGVISAEVAALTHGVLKAMFLTRFKLPTVGLLVVGILGAGTGFLTHRVLAERPTAKAVKDNVDKERVELEVGGVVKAVDTSRNTLTIHLGKKSPGEKTYRLAKDAKVFLDDGTGDRLGFQEGKPADLAAGVSVTLRLFKGKVVRLWAEGPTVEGILKKVDTTRNTITATVTPTKGKPAVDRTFAVANNAKIVIDGKGKKKAKDPKKEGLAELPVNAVVFLKLSADRKVVGSVRAEGQSVTGVVKAVKPAKNTITVTVSVTKGEPGVDKTFTVAKHAQVFVDDGKAKDKSKSDSLRDVPSGSVATLRLSLDGKAVVAIRAEGTTVHGSVKAVNAAKRTITLHDKPEGEKTYTVLKGAGVFLDGKSEQKKLADVPVKALVNLKMLADQKTVQAIWAFGPTVHGTVKGDAGEDSITIAGKVEDSTFTVAKDTPILVDEKRKGKLTELIDGTVVVLQLSADGSAALDIRAEGPSFKGIVKGLDTDKEKTITLLIGSKNGEGGENKEFKITKDTAVVTEINGVPRKLTDLKVDKEVVLRLSLDQKTTAKITVLGE
jgi:RNA polymerase sigma factor (sigma-70 family)